MRRAQAFFYVCGGILALAISFHFGATTAHSQSSSVVAAAVATGSGGGVYMTVVAENGDIWNVYPNGSGVLSIRVGNTFTGGPGPVQTEGTTLGRIKAKYR